MAQKIVVPTLSAHGWVKDPPVMMDFLLAHFFESDYIQSEIYGDHVANVQVILQQFSQDVPGLINKLQSKLSDYVGAHFPEGVSVDVQQSESKSLKPDEVAIRIFMTVTSEGTEYSVGRMLGLLNSKFRTLVKLNNEGEEE